jgi:hypothetical protein
LFAHENKGDALVFPRGRLDYDEIQMELTVHLNCTLYGLTEMQCHCSRPTNNPILQ